MHVAHFHPPRAVALPLIAAVIAIVITLAIATSVSDTSTGSDATAGRSAPISLLGPTPPQATHLTAVDAGSTPAWLASPFSPLLGRPMTPAWTLGVGS